MRLCYPASSYSVALLLLLGFPGGMPGAPVAHMMEVERPRNGQYAAADSLIQVIIAMEGGVASSHTQLMMLRLSMLQGQQTPDSLSVGQQALLNAMIAADPQGAASAKALLAAAYGNRYQRIPWELNDTRPGRSLLRGNETKLGIRLWPNPTNSAFTVESEAPMLALTLLDASGRIVRHYPAKNSALLQVNDDELMPGSYMLQVSLIHGLQTIKLFITP